MYKTAAVAAVLLVILFVLGAVAYERADRRGAMQASSTEAETVAASAGADASATSSDDVRYYAGTIGDRKVHLRYWPHIPSEDTDNHFYFDGEYVYDGRSSRILDIKLSWSSGGSMSGYTDLDGQMIDEFVDEDYYLLGKYGDSQEALDKRRCASEERAICGMRLQEGQPDEAVLLRQVAPFRIEDFLVERQG